MNFRFPSFKKGTAGTLLDAENAQQVKAFIEPWNNVRIKVGEKSQVQFTDRSVEITLARDEIKRVIQDYFEANFSAQFFEVCDNGSAVSYEFLIRKETSTSG